MGNRVKRQKVDNSLIDDELMSQTHELNHLANQPYDQHATDSKIQELMPKYTADMSLHIPTYPQQTHQKLDQTHDSSSEAQRLVHESLAAQHAAQAAAAQQYYQVHQHSQQYDYQPHGQPHTQPHGQQSQQYHLPPPPPPQQQVQQQQHQQQQQSQQQQQQQVQQPSSQQQYHLPPVHGDAYSQHPPHSGSETPMDPHDFLVTPLIEEQIFDSVDVLKEFVKEFGKKNEFGIAIAHSNNKAIYFTCELGGSYREKRNRKQQNAVNDSEPTFNENGELTASNKKINSKKIKCQFAMVANFSKKKNYWTLKITENKHNHAKLDPLTSFPMLRKRSNQVNITIKELYTTGDKPSVIHQKLQTLFQGVVIKREDIYNEIRILKKKGLVPTNTELKNRKVPDEDLVRTNSFHPQQQQSQQQHQDHLQHQGQQLQQGQHHDTGHHESSLSWATQGYQHIDPENKKEVEQQAAAAVAAVQALKDSAAAAAAVAVHHQDQIAQTVSHYQVQQPQQHHYQSQHYGQHYGQVPEPQNVQVGHHPEVKEEHFNIDERLLGGN
ncbi:hypothetical protein CANARDRAFT_181133, partial [[Candida] arabinofermentans NRRL YB-2248]